MKSIPEDSAAHQIRRQKLVEEVRSKGIDDEDVLEAIGKIPRHLFMASDQDELAYIDKAFPIGEGQTISQPYTVAYQTELLQPEPFCKVLEIGTGSGYQAAVLAEMGVELFTIERQKKLFDRNKDFQYLQHYQNIHFFYGDGYEGLPDHAPFSRILITAATPEIPPKLFEQLDIGGKMVLPLGWPLEVQRMVRLTRLANDELAEEQFDMFSFVPMLRGRQ
jgi:protein-L-isoaspartate(D-aspartate) O-methyltransferase